MRVTFIFNDYSLHNHILDHYITLRPQDQVSLVKVKLVMRGKSHIESAGKVIPRLSRMFIIEKLLEVLVMMALSFVPKLYHRGPLFNRLRRIASRRKLPFHVTRDVHAAETLQFIKDHRPDLIVTLMHQIVKSPLISIPTQGVINIHPGLLPRFRGIQPYFWELSESSAEAGVTLHFIDDEGIDTGRVIGQKSYPTEGISSVFLNYYLTTQAAGVLLPEVIAQIESGQVTATSQNLAEGNYFRWPDSTAFRRLKEQGRVLFRFWDLWRIMRGDFDLTI